MNYNIQSWPTKVQGQRFTERLAYNAAVEGLSPGGYNPWQPLWNGRISASLYAAGTDADHGFVYKYDPSGRLSRSYYSEGAEIELDDADYTEGFRYDSMDNITSLTRQVILANGTNKGTLVQKMDYYPSGLLFCDGNSDGDVQPVRFSGKELDKMHGLGTYDFGARQYNPVTMRWDRQLQGIYPHVKLKIYIPKTKRYINYDKDSTINDFNN